MKKFPLLSIHTKTGILKTHTLIGMGFQSCVFIFKDFFNIILRMSYIKTKLSKKNKNILNDIYEELEEITLPSRFQKTAAQGHSLRTGACNQKGARQVCFGYSLYRGNKQLSVFTKKYPYIMELFKEFIGSHYPDFHFNSVYVNKNVRCKRHLDSKNIGKSLLVGLGEYTGGETVLYINDNTKKFNIQNYSLVFNGSEIEHRSLPFKGTRYSLVFFKN